MYLIIMINNFILNNILTHIKEISNKNREKSIFLIKFPQIILPLYLNLV